MLSPLEPCVTATSMKSPTASWVCSLRYRSEINKCNVSIHFGRPVLMLTRQLGPLEGRKCESPDGARLGPPENGQPRHFKTLLVHILLLRISVSHIPLTALHKSTKSGFIMALQKTSLTAGIHTASEFSAHALSCSSALVKRGSNAMVQSVLEIGRGIMVWPE